MRELYQELILDHNKNPRNFREIKDGGQKSEGFNPLCGDKLTLYLKISDGKIEDISFVGSGCAISKASASLMTENLKGKTVEEAKRTFESFHQLLSGHPENADTSKLGKLTVFSGVCEYPARVKCATLAWHTFKSGLEGTGEGATTE